MPRKKTSPSIQEEPKKENLSGALNQLASAIRQLEKKMSDGFAGLKKETKTELNYQSGDLKPGQAVITTTASEPVLEVPKPESNVPFPVEWMEIIKEVLNAKFKASVNYLDSASFELTVFVPKEYSNASPQEWIMNKSDRRIKVIPNYEGAQGVRMFVEDIAKQLGQETRAKINDDRAKLTNI